MSRDEAGAGAHEVDVDAEDEAQATWLRSLALTALEALGLEAAELSVVITDDEAVRALNAQWRDKDATTDVLSFPQQEPPVLGGLLGDVVISLPTATAQAAEVGHTVEDELRVLLVHGLCHLVGMDHLDEDEAVEMARAEALLLDALAARGVGLVERAGVQR